MAERDRLPTLSNDAQLAIMNMVKGGMSMDEALKKAQEMEASEVRSKPTLPSGVSKGQLSGKDINRATMDVVTKMVQDGNLSSADALRHAEALNSVKVRKKGDAQRILLMNMVKERNISIDEAVRLAAEMGVDVNYDRQAARASLAAAEGKIYNFGVYKFSKLKGAQRRILQLDFSSKIMCNIQRGHRNNQIRFEDIERVESEDGLLFTIHVGGEARHTAEYEADSLEEKNKIFRLLSLIVSHNNSDRTGKVEEDIAKPEARVIKEGRVEKKGHTVAYFNWSSRFMRVRQGELAYYREDDLSNALNILALAQGVSSVTRKGLDMFVVHTNKKNFTFRVPPPAGSTDPAEAQVERNLWIEAIMEATLPPGGRAGNATGQGLTDAQVRRLQDLVRKMMAETAALTGLVTGGPGAPKVSALQAFQAELLKELTALPVVDRPAGAAADARDSMESPTDEKAGPVDPTVLKVHLTRPSHETPWGLVISADREVVEVEPGGIAARAGVTKGMLVLTVNTQAVAPTDETQAAQDAAMEAIGEALEALQVHMDLRRREAPPTPKIDPAKAKEEADKEKKLKLEKDADKHRSEIKRIETTLAAVTGRQKAEEAVAKVGEQLEAAIKRLNATKQECGIQDVKEVDARLAALKQTTVQARAALDAAAVEQGKAEAAIKEAEELMGLAETDEDKEATAEYMASSQAQLQAAIDAAAAARADIAAAEAEAAKLESLYALTSEVSALEAKLVSSTAEAEAASEKLARIAGVEALQEAVDAAATDLAKAEAHLAQAQKDAEDPSKALARAQDKLRQAEAKLADAHVNHEDHRRLAFLSSTDLLTSMSLEDKKMLLRRRNDAKFFPNLLPKMLSAVDWSCSSNVREAYRMLMKWTMDDSPAVALELLHYSYADLRVRAHATDLISKLADDDIECFLLQLVQVLKFEPHHDSALARLLLSRALSNRRLGNSFFWLLRSSLDGSGLRSIRLAMLLDVYVRHCGDMQQTFLVKQSTLMTYLEACNRVVPASKAKEQRNTVLQTHMMANPPPPICTVDVPMLYDIGVVAGAPVVSRCGVMDSKQRPLWIALENTDPAGEELAILAKCGDDLRQDMLTLQMITVMDKLWQHKGLDLHMTPYGCTATTSEGGVIQIVGRAKTVASIQRAYGGTLSAFKEEPLYEWLRSVNTAEDQFAKARDTFTMSCAGYCVATYVLGIGDRHNDNIMVSQDGHFFHIDFGHFLGNIKKFFGVSRERAPFVLTPDFIYVMGRKDGPRFKKFVRACVDAYDILRQHARLLIALFAMMLSTGIPELNSAEDIRYLQNALSLDMPTADALAAFEKLIYECINLNWGTQVNFWFHNMAH
eukprot:m.166145 g.166145  ORF g.166145 m.166145 type:complete len:1343 (+) comp9898_c0_seq4:65-4093(+)